MVGGRVTRTYVLTLRECPKSVNAGGGGSRANHFVASREKRRWQGAFLAELMIAKVPKGMTHCKADVTIRWKHKNHRDLENYRHPVVKPLADTLAPPKGSHAPRWLPDDTEEFFEVTGFRFEYPPEWPSILSKVELIVKLTATYEE